MANKSGQTPLLTAINNQSDTWIIAFLIEKGANVLHTNHQGENALYLAFKKNRVEIMDLLINTGAYVSEKTNLNPILHLACISERISPSFCQLLIQNGANLHVKYNGKSIFELLCDKTSIYDGKVEIYRNALIKDLSNTFKYADYDKFKQRVVESIGNEEVIVVELDHLKALSQLSRVKKEENQKMSIDLDSGDLEEQSPLYDEKKLKAVIAHLKSLEFREKFIVDYLNVLDDLKELLSVREQKLTETVAELTNAFEQKKKRFKGDPVRLKLNELISEELFEHLLDSVKAQSDSEDKLFALNNIIENITLIIAKTTNKIKIKIKRWHHVALIGCHKCHLKIDLENFFTKNFLGKLLKIRYLLKY